MNGYWHLPAISVVGSIICVLSQNKWIIVPLLVWFGYLYLFKWLGKTQIILSLAFFLFFLFYIPVITPTEYTTPANNSTINGKIKSSIDETNNKIDLVLHENNTDRVFLITYFFSNNELISSIDRKKLTYGANCVVNGKIELPESSRNPGQFDYQTYLLSRGITYQMTLDSLEDIQCTGASSISRLYDLRYKLFSYISDMTSVETSAWLNGLVLGNDVLIDENVIDLFRRWNLSHLLAISGLHVGLVITLFYFLLIKLGMVTREKATWILLLFLPCYALIAGGEPSVWRASMMVMLFIILKQFKLRLSVTDVLSIVMMILILFDPYIVYHVGFQLSFAVTLGLLLSKNWIRQSQSSVWTIAKISFISQMMILPFQFSYFYTFQPLSILLNIVIVPYFSFFVIPFLFLVLLLSPIKWIVTLMDAFFVIVHSFVINFIERVDQLAYFPWVSGPLPGFTVILYYGLLLFFMSSLEKGKLTRAFTYGCMKLVLICVFLVKPYFSNVGSITMLDIGQGDAFVIELPYRKGVILIDAGSTFSFEDREPTSTVKEQIIEPYLHSRGIQQIDAIFISHEDTDHNGSVSYLMNDFSVKKVIVSQFYPEDDTTWGNNETQLVRMGQNDRIAIGEHQFFILGPAVSKQDPNENSLVIYTTLGGKRWLFTGDIGKETEKELIQTYPNLRVDVLKVAHHGSDTSTEDSFLETVDPSIAMISVGIENRYGHPTNNVLTLLHEEGVRIFRTDIDGAVQFQFKDEDGTFFKYLP
ncbi:DNA internalization-related competence protein ComEC/Rec2 [Oceanobacillus halotolerans]|uniref:DNA internalization-related competence protein ComEC/Rec2 n=1 Tax=Oceanobacillus halotolerans TaxID=2663380 RepID=UPI0013DA035A|nr:DNA internalization-related competence protein ComEC/Rec2 [Oceanobacillus halotolerans]